MKEMSAEEKSRAHVVPFAVFMGLLLLFTFADPIVRWNHPLAPWWRRAPEHWFYPLQAFICAGVLWKYRRAYQWNISWKASALAVVAGAVGIGFWLLPTTLYDALHLTKDPDNWMKLLGIASRTKDGFEPGIFREPWAFWTTLSLRFFRAVVIVALVEEIFWRGWLMRVVNDRGGNLWKQPFGEASWRSWGLVTGAFTLAHAPIDWAGAIVFGSLMYGVCVRTKSLAACVLMHAVANFLMGCYIMAYGKYGLW